jgi:hypothetical protein
MMGGGGCPENVDVGKGNCAAQGRMKDGPLKEARGRRDSCSPRYASGLK